MGVSNAAKRFTLERTARNTAEWYEPDHRGWVPGLQKVSRNPFLQLQDSEVRQIREEDSITRTSTLAEALTLISNNNEGSYTLSDDPGGYLCNYIL